MSDWRPEEGSFRALWKALFQEPNKGHVLLALINRFPVYTYPLGEASYWKSVDSYGEETILSPHNTWRAICHALGGAAVSVPVVPFVGCLISVSTVALIIFSTEIIGPIASGDKITLKSFYDILCWTLGSLSACVIFSSL
jgi:hypothetical protein